MGTATWANVMDALKTSLDARAGLDGVNVYTAHPGKKLLEGPDSAECIIIGFDGSSGPAVSGSQEPGRFGPTNDEDYVIHCWMHSKKPSGGETVAVACRDRVEAMLAEVEDELTDDSEVNGTCAYARIAGFELYQGYTDHARYSIVEFGIAVKSLL